MFRSLALATIAATLSVVGIAPAALAQTPGASVLVEFTIIADDKSAFFGEFIFPLEGDQNIHYGVYGQAYGNIGGGPAGNAGGYVHFSQVPIDQCGMTIFGGVTSTSQPTGTARFFCQF